MQYILSKQKSDNHVQEADKNYRSHFKIKKIEIVIKWYFQDLKESTLDTKKESFSFLSCSLTTRF